MNLLKWVYDFIHSFKTQTIKVFIFLFQNTIILKTLIKTQSLLIRFKTFFTVHHPPF